MNKFAKFMPLVYHKCNMQSHILKIQEHRLAQMNTDIFNDKA